MKFCALHLDCSSNVVNLTVDDVHSYADTRTKFERSANGASQTGRHIHNADLMISADEAMVAGSRRRSLTLLILTEGEPIYEPKSSHS